jgi:phage baseplate assembly protein V
MQQGLIETAAEKDHGNERPIYGVAVAQVIDNEDLTNQGRVQLALPWLPCVKPWARVAVLMAGNKRGTYFMPQVGDEVLVAFNNGNVTDPYVLGSLWNGEDKTPANSPKDAVNKQIIHTPQGHELLFDDTQKTISITSITNQKVTISEKEITLVTANETATVKLETSGKITFESDVSIDIKAPQITIDGKKIEIKGSTTSIKGDSLCQIEGSMVKIN